MKIYENDRKWKKFQRDRASGKYREKIETALLKELQYAEAAEKFGEYHDIPRPGPKRCHVLEPKGSLNYAVGLDYKIRTVVNPGKENLESDEITIVEYAIDYH